MVCGDAECQREMMSFMSMRLEKDSETTREILGCGSLADVTAIQSRWLEETVRDYNSEVTKLMGIYTESVKGGGHAGGAIISSLSRVHSNHRRLKQDVVSMTVLTSGGARLFAAPAGMRNRTIER